MPKNQIIIPWEQFVEDTRWLAEKVICTGKRYEGIVGVARGGLIPAAILGRELGIRRIESICASSYEDDGSGSGVGVQAKSVRLTQTPNLPGEGEGFLFVDDIADTGLTTRAIKKRYPLCTFVAVTVKPRGAADVDLFAKAYPQLAWVHFPWEIGLSHVEPVGERLSRVPGK